MFLGDGVKGQFEAFRQTHSEKLTELNKDYEDLK